MESIVKAVEHLIHIFTKDAKRGPKWFLIFLGIMFFWILLMQGIDADLWYDHGYGDVPAIEVSK